MSESSEERKGKLSEGNCNTGKKLQSQLDVCHVEGEWRVYSVDQEVEQLEKGQRVDHFWRAVFSLKVS